MSSAQVDMLKHVYKIAIVKTGVSIGKNLTRWLSRYVLNRSFQERIALHENKGKETKIALTHWGIPLT